MGTAIACFFPASLPRSPDRVAALVSAAFDGLHDELAAIARLGRFSGSDRGEWWFEREDGDGNVYGEGPCGFHARVCKRCLVLAQVERIAALTSADYHRGADLRVPLRRAIEHVGLALTGGDRVAVAASGFGDTDAAADLAADGGSFEAVCDRLAGRLGDPARTWHEFESGEAGWYLKGPPQRSSSSSISSSEPQRGGSTIA